MFVNKARAIVQLSARETDMWANPTPTFSVPDLARTLARRLLNDPKWRQLGITQVGIRASDLRGGHTLDVVS